MILGKVVGSVWCTRKDARLERYKLLLIRPYFYYHPAHEIEQVVAVDTLGAGVGEDVVVCLGTPARWSLGGENLPVDAAVMGIVDRCQFQRRAFSVETKRPLRFLGERPPQKMEWV
jgi:ethanolamine utilization protein EutN